MTIDTQDRAPSVVINGTGSRSGTGRAVWPAILNGVRSRCPRCGYGNLYHAYLKVSDECPSCDLELHHQRADDAPPYFTMFIVGHLLVPMVLIVERMWKPEWWVHLALWGPLTIVLTLWLLPMVKGGIMAVQWAMGMHGFGDGEADTALDVTHLDDAPGRERL